jgi:RNA recognition motif-containing protein
MHFVCLLLSSEQSFSGVYKYNCNCFLSLICFTEERVESEHGVSVAHDSTKDNRTVFVSNLNYSVDDTTLKEVFSSMGTITDLRLVKDFKGRSKGFCFVEFSSPVSSLLWTHIGVYSNRYTHMYSSHSYFIMYVPG